MAAGARSSARIAARFITSLRPFFDSANGQRPRIDALYFAYVCVVAKRRNIRMPTAQRYSRFVTIRNRNLQKIAVRRNAVYRPAPVIAKPEYTIGIQTQSRMSGSKRRGTMTRGRTFVLSVHSTARR